MARVQDQYAAPRASLEVDNGLRPVVIENVKPQVDHGRFATKRTPGETVVVEADVCADGQDQ
jgi:starch synthase (maltosyl-transferring)